MEGNNKFELTKIFTETSLSTAIALGTYRGVKMPLSLLVYLIEDKIVLLEVSPVSYPISGMLTLEPSMSVLAMRTIREEDDPANMVLAMISDYMRIDAMTIGKYLTDGGDDIEVENKMMDGTTATLRIGRKLHAYQISGMISEGDKVNLISSDIVSLDAEVGELVKGIYPMLRDTNLVINTEFSRKYIDLYEKKQRKKASALP